MTRTLLPLCLALTVAACSEPRPPACDRVIARELRTIDMLIAETERNMQTGFRTERAPARSGLNLCFGSSRNNVGLSFCTDGANRTRAVAIDPEVEARKLSGLRDRRAELLAADPACPAAE
ncbi:hypothetical protein OEW28_03365 [Defluviimonas sp. WL0002]|uniref:Uncharacterized protein n=1 Tax=Albidovulum marisflavi TaxID=2984159 RepID=A0ABT2Z9A8_9RHOB|nr:hypothetical protein [Defluviimonas sp. WL0002]MCV2867663.1 hypothetical protein [Defluviimonas sp. WL0002]